MNQNWISLKTEEFQREKTDTRFGNNVSYFFSPYNIPTAVKGTTSPDAKEAIIQFKYIDGIEPTFEQRADNGVVFVFGKNSQRIFQIKIPTSQIGDPHTAIIEINGMLKVFEHDKPRSRDNYGITGRVMSNYDNQLFQPAT